jgi:uncharacterized SAM-binding protein YcdF (DUF218 family)
MHFSKPPLKLALLALAALGALGALLAWGFPQQILCVDSGNVRADALVVLGGGSYERPARAAELFHSGAAPKIIVSGAGDWANNYQILSSAGVPGEAITFETLSQTTDENAAFSVPVLRAARARHVIIVTSWYHSRRALKTFRHYAPEIRFYSRPAYYAYPRTQWSRQGITGYIRAEYVKLAGYWVCYGICPF